MNINSKEELIVISCSSGKDNEKNHKMKSHILPKVKTIVKSRKEPENASKLFP